MNNKYITVSEFANIINMNNTETFKFLKNNFEKYIMFQDNIAMIDADFVNSFIELKEDLKKETNTFEIDFLKNQLEEKQKRIEELQIKLEEYTTKAFELAQSALNIQQQLNYITASKEIKKESFIKRIFKKGISE